MLDPINAIKEFVSHPSVSADSQYKAGMDGAREYISGLIASLGFSVEIVKTPLHPIILAERRPNPEWPHVVIYGHYDVQPADPFEKWTSEPFTATERNGRLYGRGTADNKGPFMVHVTAVAQLLKEHPDLPLNITFLVEGEEEIGSPSFDDFLKEYKERLKGDFVLLSDTLSPSPEQIVLTTGLRGLTCLEVEVIGPRTDLHSGIHGGTILNPIQALMELCATLHNPDGSVNVPGFYDDIVNVEDWEREEIARLGADPEVYRKFLGVKDFHTLPGYTPFEATRLAPTLEFNGIGGGYQGEGSKTVIPSRAFTKISCRLVANQDPNKIRELVAKTLKERCSDKVQLNVKVDHSGVPYSVVPPGRPNTPADQPKALADAFRAADVAIADVFGKKPLYLREGGSVPIIASLKSVVGLDSLMMGMFTPDDNLHAPDESCDIQMILNGVEASKRILAKVAGV